MEGTALLDESGFAQRRVTPDEVEEFWADGVVCLREILPLELITSMERPVAEALMGEETTDMTELADAMADGGSDVARDRSATGMGRFRGGVDHWLVRDEFRSFALNSAVAEVVAQVLRASTLRLYEDSVLSKEPGSAHKTVWHQDISYFNVSGDQLATTWVPLDFADQQSGAMRFVRGSHRWGVVYQPNLFVSNEVIPGADGEPVPDIDGSPDQFDIIEFELGPGDLSIHHAATLHAAGANRSSRQRRAISIRYIGDDARYLPRPSTIGKPAHRGLNCGDAFTDDAAPVAWQQNRQDC